LRISSVNVRSILSFALALSLVLIPTLGHTTPMEWSPPDTVSGAVDVGLGPTDPLVGDDGDDLSLGEYDANRILTGAAILCFVFCHGGGAPVVADPDLPGTPLSEVPEPATAALLATGLLGLGWVRRQTASGFDRPRS